MLWTERRAGQAACTEEGAPQRDRVVQVTTHGRDQSRCPRLRLSHASFIQPGGNWHGRSHGSSRCLGYK